MSYMFIHWRRIRSESIMREELERSLCMIDGSIDILFLYPALDTDHFFTNLFYEYNDLISNRELRWSSLELRNQPSVRILLPTSRLVLLPNIIIEC